MDWQKSVMGRVTTFLREGPLIRVGLSPFLEKGNRSLIGVGILFIGKKRPLFPFEQICICLRSVENRGYHERVLSCSRTQMRKQLGLSVSF